MKHRRRIWLACVPIGVVLASGCAGTEPDPRPANASDAGSAFTVIEQPATGQLLDDLTSAPDITRGSGCAEVRVDASGNITEEPSGDCGEISYPRSGDVPLVVGSLRLDDDAEALFVTFTARDGTPCYAVVLRDGAEPVGPATCHGWDDLSGRPPGPCSRFCVEQLGLGRFVDTPFVVALVPEEGTKIDVARRDGSWVTFALDGPIVSAFPGLRLFMAQVKDAFAGSSVVRDGEEPIAAVGEPCINNPDFCHE